MFLGSPQLDIAELKQPVGQNFPHQVSGSYEIEIRGAWQGKSENEGGIS